MKLADKLKLNVAMFGKSDCIADAVYRSARLGRLDVFSDFINPGLKAKATVVKGTTSDPASVVEFAKHACPDLAIIGSEEPLANGIVDALNKLGIPCVGPTQKLAQLEASKSFTRDLLFKHGIPGNPEYRVFKSYDELPSYLAGRRDYVIKPDGLTGGKGVWVYGDHFTTSKEALDYCKELFGHNHRAVVIEEKLDGEEFSFQSFFDGRNIAHMIPVQDHKRAVDDDTGPNTGGMGSYSCADHLLPFLTKRDIEDAGRINDAVGKALFKEASEEYKGILYGGFMLTKNGLRVIEYNSRFGDPEVMNILSLLETDFLDICEAIVDGTLDKISVKFRNQASVCKYLVPEGYPGKGPAVGTAIDVQSLLASPELNHDLRLYYAAVNDDDGVIRLTDSRSVAVVGIGDTLDEAEAIAERAASSVKGKVFHRRDIGTAKLIQKRTDHMKRLSNSSFASKRIAAG